MKKCIITILLLSWGICYAYGQQAVAKRAKSYEVWVKKSNNDVVFRGILYEIKDSSILVTSSRYNPEISVFKFNEINKQRISNL